MRPISEISPKEAFEIIVKNAHIKHEGHMKEAHAMGGSDVYWSGCPAGDPLELGNPKDKQCTCGADHKNKVIEALAEKVRSVL